MSESQAVAIADKAGRYLTFGLGDEEYGVEILKVREIIGIQNVTRVPKAPAFVRGVINLRGRVLPVIDLRLKFEMREREYDRRTCIIIVQIEISGVEMAMGIIVDEVSEVVDVAANQVEPPPSFGCNLDTEFIQGMGKLLDKVVILLDIDKVLSSQELVNVDRITTGATN